MYIGSNAVDDIKIGSNSVDAVYIGDTQVWSAIPADVKAHIARVVADGGTVPNQASMVSSVKKLIAANLWNNCVFFGLPLGGVKKDDNQYVSKVYDLKANADLLQGTGTAQPKYSNGNLLYDGGDVLLSSKLYVNNPIRNALVNISCICTVNIPSISTGTHIFGRYSGTALDTSSWLMYKMPNNTFRVEILNASNVVCKTYDTSAIIADGTNHHIGFTFDGNASEGGVVGLLKLYIDGVNVSVTKVNNSALPTLRNFDYLLHIGGNGKQSLFIPNGSQTALHQIYNSALTAEQMLWNFNNIRPEGV